MHYKQKNCDFSQDNNNNTCFSYNNTDKNESTM